MRWTVELVRKRVGLLPRAEFLWARDPRLPVGRRMGLSTELMLTAVTIALNGDDICWSAHSPRYAKDQAHQIRMWVYHCDPTCKSKIEARSPNRRYTPGVRLGDHYGGEPTKRYSSSSSGRRR